MIEMIKNKIEMTMGVSLDKLLIRILFGILLTSWIGFLPIYLIIHFMVNMQFFSYDIFTDGVFGLKTFVFVAGIMSILLSFALWGFVPLAVSSYIAKKNHSSENANRVYAWLIFVLATFFHTILFINAMNKGQVMTYFIFSTLGLCVCLFMCLFVGQPFKKQLLNWFPSAFFVAITALLPFMSPSTNAEIVGLGLKAFRIGGLLSVKAFNASNKEILGEGDLILQTPNNLYIRGKHRELIIVPYSQQTVIKIYN